MPLAESMEQERGVECGQNGMDSDPDQNESGGSWVAEDDSPVTGSTGMDTEPTLERTGMTSLANQPRQRLLDKSVPVMNVVNPAFGTVSRHVGQAAASSLSGFRTNPGRGSTGFNSRPFQTRPLSTSTPQMSPINEEGYPHFTPKVPYEVPASRHVSTRNQQLLSHRSSRRHGDMWSTNLLPQTTRDAGASRLSSIPEQNAAHVATPTSR